MSTVKEVFRHINSFAGDAQDTGREFVELVRFSANGRILRCVVCEVFDAAVQHSVEMVLPWQRIMDFVDRREPLGLFPAHVVAVLWQDGSRSYASARTRWNPVRGTHELVSVHCGGRGGAPVLLVQTASEECMVASTDVPVMRAVDGADDFLVFSI